MIKVDLSSMTAERAAIPDVLTGLASQSLQDLSWTDRSLGLQNYAWWPAVDHSPALGEFERYGAETLTVDADNMRVVVTRAVIAWTQDEIDAINRVEISRLDFMERFTHAELESIYTAAKTSVGVQVFIDKLKMHEGLVDLSSPTLKAGVDALVSGGVLTQFRADAILSTEAVL